MKQMLLAGVAALAVLGTPTQAQENAPQTAQPAEQQAQGKAAAQDTSATTLLDRILVVSRTGESSIESLASTSQVDQEQIDRRMAATSQDLLFGVPGVALQRQYPRSAGLRSCRGDCRRRGRISSGPVTAPNRWCGSTPNW
jgi:hemoglobin/transferrin/lactoferrin receptor protein